MITNNNKNVISITRSQNTQRILTLNQDTNNYSLTPRSNFQQVSPSLSRLVEFGTRIDGFQKHFFSFNDRVVKLQQVSGSFQNQSNILKDRMASLTDTFHSVSDKTQEESQKARFMMADQVSHFKQIQAKLKLSQQTNEKILSQNVKTKNKFIELSNNISEVRIELQKKINKFVESNISINVQIKGMFSTLSNDMFRMNTTVQNQQKRFETGMLKLDEQVAHGKEMKQRFVDMQNDLLGKVNLKELEKYLLEAQTQLQTSNRRLEQRLLEQISGMIEKSPLLVDLIKQIKLTRSDLQIQEQDIDRMQKNLLGRFIDFQSKINTFSEQAEKNTAKQFQKIEKVFQAKLQTAKTQTNVMRKQFSLNIKQLKKEMQTLLSQKTQEMIKQQKVAQEQKQLVSQEIIVQQLKQEKQEQQNSFNKRLEMLQGRFTNLMREQMNQIMNEVKVDKGTNNGVGIDKQLMDNLLKEVSDNMNEKIRIKFDEVMERAVSNENKYNTSNEIVREQMKRMAAEIEGIGGGFDSLKRQVERQNELARTLFQGLRSETQERLEKLSFIITKLRGDLTLKTDFTSKEIKEVIKKLAKQTHKLEGLLMLVPAIGETINLILVLCFDNQANKSNISDKFMTMLEGILYECKGKSKSIHYRHKSLSKIGLIKAAFMGYTDIWQSLLQGHFRGMNQYFPKSFYTQYVQKRLQSILNEKDEERRASKSPQHFKKTSIHILKQQAEQYQEQVSQQTFNNHTQGMKKPTQFSIRRQKSFDKSKTLTQDGLGIFQSPTRRNSKQFTQLQFK